jgi:hypothetical protein
MSEWCLVPAEGRAGQKLACISCLDRQGSVTCAAAK